jgi:hypothetical protein
MEEVDLRQRAREAIQIGNLPSRHPDRTWGGPGVGAACPVCELPVKKEEMEFEVQFARDGSEGDRQGGDRHFDIFHIHVRCFAAWELERVM